ncbi:putative uncharacterized protein [Parabacteroides sp. CAG:409]|nr:putative uncharacterized protein [Parabacteroides sp. CAG:409]
MYSIIVGECGIQPDYFLDKMQWYEINALLNGRENRTSWEQTRMICYMIAQVNSTKKLKPTDILSFTWDDKKVEDTAISNTDIDRLKNKAKQTLKLL